VPANFPALVYDCNRDDGKADVVVRVYLYVQHCANIFGDGVRDVLAAQAFRIGIFFNNLLLFRMYEVSIQSLLWHGLAKWIQRGLNGYSSVHHYRISHMLL